MFPCAAKAATSRRGGTIRRRGRRVATNTTIRNTTTEIQQHPQRQPQQPQGRPRPLRQGQVTDPLNPSCGDQASIGLRHSDEADGSLGWHSESHGIPWNPGHASEKIWINRLKKKLNQSDSIEMVNAEWLNLEMWQNTKHQLSESMMNPSGEFIVSMKHHCSRQHLSPW